MANTPNSAGFFVPAAIAAKWTADLAEAAAFAVEQTVRDAGDEAVLYVQDDVKAAVEAKHRPALPNIPDDEHHRPHPVGAGASADELYWEATMTLFSTGCFEVNATEEFRTTGPTRRTIYPHPYAGPVEFYHNAPAPGRHLAMHRFEEAVYDAGGVITCRFGSRCAGESRDCYPHEALGRPDGDGWVLYDLIGLLSAGQVRALVEERFGPLDVPYGGTNAA